MTPPIRYHGINLLQHMAVCEVGQEQQDAITTTPVHVKPRLPCLLLPLYRGEKPIVGPEALTHRRSIGLRWPPEAQVSADGSEHIGRVPLVAAWNRLELDDNERNFGATSTEFNWRPTDDEAPISICARDILAQSALTFTDIDSNDKLATIVPDSMTDGALHQLKEGLTHNAHLVAEAIDPYGVNLLWRSAAMAMTWCSAHQTNFQETNTSFENHQKLGNVICISLGMDSFELVVCGVQTQEYNDEHWLVPVVNRQADQFKLGTSGTNLLTALALEDKNSVSTPAQLWNKICASSWAHERLQSNDAIPTHLFRSIYQDSEMSRFDQWLDKAGYLQHIHHEEPDYDFEKSLSLTIIKRIYEQIELLDKGYAKTLGVVIDGCFASLPVSSSGNLAQTIKKALELKTQWKGERFLVGTGELAAHGAARFAWCAATDRPTYREKLKPIELYAEKLDEVGDPIASWTPLVDTDTVEGGRPYSQRHPLEGLLIPHGSQQLNLGLRQKTGYREVPAKLDMPTSQDEPVFLNVTVIAGQGYPTVEVESAKPGLFRKNLDWALMEKKEEPKIHMAYIKRVWKVRSDRELWQEASYYCEQLLETLDTNRTDKIRQALLQLADCINRRVYPENGDGWSQIGPVGSNGKVSTQAGHELLAKTLAAIESRFTKTRSLDIRKTIIRIGGWSYTAMPASLQDVVRSQLREVQKFPYNVELNYHQTSLRNDRIKQVFPTALTAAGQAFHTSRDMKLVFNATAVRFSQTMDGTNNWLRMIRNLVQYRQDALSQKCISNESIEFITEKVIERLGEQQDLRNYKQIMDNCLRIIIFLLKRRRYQTSFLNPKSAICLLLQERLNHLIETTRTHRQGDGYPKPAQKDWAKIILPFLKQTATDADEASFLKLLQSE